MHKRTVRLTALAIASAAAVMLTGCSGSNGGSGSGSGSASDGHGPITFASGKDLTGSMPALIDQWNSKHPKEQVKFLELAASPDDQRNSFIQDLQAKSGKYDVMWMDVVWTSEFAARGWLEPLDKAKVGGPDLLPPAVDTAIYDGKLYGAPFITNAGLLFYRSDLVPTAPTSWEELRADCAIAKQNNMDCFAGQFNQYEGLTVNAAEAINGAGGTFLSDDGKKVTVDSPEARAGLQNLVDMFKDGEINPEAITYQEEESRRAFVEGRLMFLRNWPYVYTSASAADSVIKDKFSYTTLPGLTGPGASSLGGIDLAVSAYSKNKGTAKDWIEFMQSSDSQKNVVQVQNQASVRTDLYTDPELVKVSPYLPVLQKSLETAVPRPKTPNYNAVSLTIQENAYAALQGKKTVDQAITDMAAGLKKAIG
jgi:multiple sugar transport system substrate-binding protein